MEQQQMQPQGESSSKTGMWVGLSILLTALIVGGGVFMWQQSSLSSTEEDLQAQIDALETQVMTLEDDMDTAEPAPVSNTIDDDSSTNLVTYDFNSYGVSFEYDPVIYKLTEDAQADSAFVRIANREEVAALPVPNEGSQSISISVYDNSLQLTALEWLEENSNRALFSEDFRIGDYSETTIAGGEAIQYEARGLGSFDMTVISKGDVVVVIENRYFLEDAEIRAYEEQILNSLSIN